jgi:diguanylate cyclase (GGDEF)-like protein/PAS domain S-box-containing protein
VQPDTLDLERADPMARLWRVASFEFDLATDVVYWFDDPGAALNLYEADAANLLEPVLVAARQGAPWDHYDLHRTVEDRAGDAVDLRVQARLLYARDESVAGVVGIVTDVSEQRRGERELRGVLDRYQRLVELNPDPVVVHQAGVVRYVSPATLEVSGVKDPSEWVGRGILDFIHPSSLEDTLERIAGLTEPGMVSEPSEVLLLGPDGKPRPYESISVCIEWDGDIAHQVILRSMAERRRAEAALRYQASLITHVSDAVVAADLNGTIRGWNPAAEALYGRSAVEAVGHTVRQVLGPHAVEEDGTTRSGEVEHRRADGMTLTVSVAVAPLRDDLGNLTGSVAVCTDLTARLERRAAEARYRVVVEALEEGVIVVDRDDTIVSVNASARTMIGDWLRVGLTTASLLERWPTISERGMPYDLDDHPLTVALRTGTTQSGVVVGTVGETTRWFALSAHPLTDDARPQGDAVACSFTEITDRKRVEEALSFQATHDPLTRLPNRDQILERLNQAAADEREGVRAALLLIDFDRFKMVNDTFGHAVGDRVLESVAQRIADVVGERGELGRLAGDEFVVVCPGIHDADTARDLAVDVGDAIQRPVRLPSGRELVVTASIGIACDAVGVQAPEVLLSHADVAMYRAKERGRDRIEVFDAVMQAAMSRRLLIHEGLRRAVDTDELTIHYQPIVRCSDRAVVGVEALARWQHHGLGPVSPAEFIPVAEDTGLMTELGGRIMQHACSDLARWTREQRCPPDLALNVNISARQLTDPGLVTVISGTLDATGLDADRLWLEVTETVLMEDADHIASALKELRAVGVHLAIDDFGTGYSSLAYLKRFPVEALKIDQSFVQELGSDPESQAIVAAIVTLAQSLHLHTIAEGIETEDQLERLRELGCDLLQGYFLAPPKASHLMYLPRRGEKLPPAPVGPLAG